MDKTRAAARQANAMQRLAEHLPGITDRLAAIEQQLAAPVEVAELAPSESPATIAQVTEIVVRLNAIEAALSSLGGLAEQLTEIKTQLARLPQPQNQRR